MERRNFLKILPIAAISPKVVKDGVVSFELPRGGHYVIAIDQAKVNFEDLLEMPGLLPEGATGGWIIHVHGNPDEAIKFYRLDDGDKTGHDSKT